MQISSVLNILMVWVLVSLPQRSHFIRFSPRGSIDHDDLRDLVGTGERRSTLNQYGHRRLAASVAIRLLWRTRQGHRSRCCRRESQPLLVAPAEQVDRTGL